VQLKSKIQNQYMPFIKVQTSISEPEKSEVESLLKSLSAKLAKHTGKP
jgi:ABC-type cobalt transport system substrate-binding protein